MMDFFWGEVVVNIVRKGENAIFTKMLSKVIVHEESKNRILWSKAVAMYVMLDKYRIRNLVHGMMDYSSVNYYHFFDTNLSYCGHIINMLLQGYAHG